MSLVVDSSMTLAWCFEDERTDHATAVLRQVAEQGALVPSLWHLEVANGLQTAIRRGRITPTFRDSTLTDLGTLSISVDAQTEHLAWSTTLQLAERFQLTLYDAAYLELAHRTGLVLASLDGALCRAATALGVPLIGQGAQ